MTDKIEGMSDKGTLRDASKMVSHRLMYAMVSLVVLVLVGFTVYSVTDSRLPNQPPAPTTTQWFR